MHERDLIKKAKDHIAAIGGIAFKYHGGPFSEAGVPDILCCLAGRFVAIEMKVPGNAPTPIQLRQIQRLTKAGAYAFVCSDIEDLKKRLAHLVDSSSCQPSGPAV